MHGMPRTLRCRQTSNPTRQRSLTLNYGLRNRPHLVREINELLTERRRTPLIPSFNDRWSLERRNQMLQLAVNEFTWDHYQQIGTVLWEHRQQPWAAEAADYPLVFAAKLPVTQGQGAGSNLELQPRRSISLKGRSTQ